MPDPIGILPLIDVSDVRALRFEINLLLDEMSAHAAEVLEAKGMVQAKLAQLERAYEARAARAHVPTDDDTE